MTIEGSEQPVQSKRGLVPFSESLARELFAFQEMAYPDRRVDWLEPRWRWMFLDSAARLGVAPMVWLYRGRTGIVAHQGAIPVVLYTAAGERVTGWFVETMVLQEARGKAVGPMLVAKAREDLPVNLSLGQTEQMRKMQYQLGWRHVGVMDSWLLVLKASNAFRGRVASSILRAGVAATGWGWQRLLRVLPSGAGRSRTFEAVPIEQFGADHDRLWGDVKSQYGCAVARDASYLNWKYVAQPGQHFQRLELREAGKVVGVCVWTTHAPDRTHYYRRCSVVDFVASHVDRVAIRALLNAVAAKTAQEGADVLEFDLMGKDLIPHLRRCGFIRGAPTRHLLVSDGGSDHAAALLATPGAWYLTRGDSDGDHPWRSAAGRRHPD